ncbi:MAG: D-alanyl-D-alanine carboxypeptidase/D-alanyl-D-alanine-endopeptidase [Verrucomicrobia bacterium]|nr:MAG: D-alanyl-D-alanine carboxypeptidase/D-alanyl-D-alanine-endopeptidase [Verrucomicrobiota bacterium]
MQLKKFLILTQLLLASAIAQSQVTDNTLSELRQRIVAIVSQPQFDGAMWGVQIISLGSQKTVFETNAHKLFSPASNSKLYTVALALDRLGPDFRIKTSLFAKSKPNKRGTLSGDLIIYGRGDPCINARLHGGDIFQALEPLVAALTNAGVKRIKGDLIADDSFIRGPEFGSGWSWEDLEFSYGAEISALTINDNVLEAYVSPSDSLGKACSVRLRDWALPHGRATVRVGEMPALVFSNYTVTAESGSRRSIHFYRPLKQNVVYVSGQMPSGGGTYTNEVTLSNPAGLFARLFREALARHGIKIGGRIRTVNWLDRQIEPLDPASMVELGYMESLPMRDLAREVQKPSQNLYADLLLAQVGEQSRQHLASPGEAETTGRRTRIRGNEATSEELGLAELTNFLGRVGIKSSETIFEEGSGLSRNNLTTPAATIQLLEYMDKSQCGGPFKESLPIAGVDGTLRNRMKGTPAAGNVRAKTGSLLWSAAISGFVTTAASERLAFSIMLNRYHQSGPGQSAREELDKIVVLLARFQGKTGE